MTELNGLHAEIRPDVPATSAAALRAVMLRVDDGRLTREDAHVVLAALGLVPTERGGKWLPNGCRNSNRPRRKPQVDEQPPSGGDQPEMTNEESA